MGAVQEHATALGDAIVATLRGWVQESVRRRAEEGGLDAESRERLDREAAEAGTRAVDDVGPGIRALLEEDIDVQSTTPLALVRQAVRYPTEVLQAAGLPPVDRDPEQVLLFPDDPYDLTPARLADVDPALHELSLVWGAAKAFEHLQRHRPRGESAS